MKALSMLVLASLVLLPALGWAQSAPATPDATAPRAQTPSAPVVPGDRVTDDSRIFGLSPQHQAPRGGPSGPGARRPDGREPHRGRPERAQRAAGAGEAPAADQAAAGGLAGDP